MNDAHRHWMERALELARRGEGLTRPNPPVGAVVVQDGRLVGAGWHRRAGGPHAEVYALRQAGERARGATLYVTLEPCSTHGRTPPCTDAIRTSGIAEVVWAATDPAPGHRGSAGRLLRSAGVRVVTGVCRAEGEALLAPFACRLRTGRPYVTLKMAMTLDGRIADRRGLSRWITGPAARAEVQRLRRRADAVMVGAGTVRTDDPSLWPRPAGRRTPWRVVMDPAGRTSPRARVYTDERAAHTLVALGRSVPAARVKAYGRHGAAPLWVPAGRVASVRSVLKQLAGLGALHVLCEGGGQLAASLLRAGVVDELVFFVAPAVLGAAGDFAVVGGPGWLLPGAPRLKFIEQRTVGPDLMIRAVPVPQQAATD